MSADLLRRAANRMRTLAQDATPSADPHPGGWRGFSDGIGNGRAQIYGGPAEDGYRTGIVLSKDSDCEECCQPSPSDVEHITSWHPAVAVAVADWLIGEAEICEALAAMGLTPKRPRAEAVALAYLGEATS